MSHDAHRSLRTQNTRCGPVVALVLALAAPGLIGEDQPPTIPDLPKLPDTPSNDNRWALEEAFPMLRFTAPLYLCVPPVDDGYIYIVEQPGTIKRFRNAPDTQETEVYLDISATVESTQGNSGLLCMAFHPEFGREGSTSRGYFYVYYTTQVGGLPYYRLSRFEVLDGAQKATRTSETILIQQLDEDPIHNGGCLQFGPDGFLYISVGDEGAQGDPFESGQKIGEDLFCGVFRIDVDRKGGEISHPPPRRPKTGQTANYYIPNDNPFVGVEGALEEFWSIGFRSPHRMSFDSVTGDLWLGDVGHATWESVELLRCGSNHQWSYREGFAQYTESYLKGKPPERYFGQDTPPIYHYLHAQDNRCVIGGYVYRGRKFASLYGHYLFADHGSGRVWAMQLDGHQPLAIELLARLSAPWPVNVSSFGVDHDQEVYLCVLGTRHLGDGMILKLTERPR